MSLHFDAVPGQVLRVNTSIAIGMLTLIVGVVFGQGHLWIPIAVIAAGVTWLFARPWASSDRLGSAQATSAVLKLSLNLIGLCATLGQVACLVLMGVWLFA